MTASAKDQAEAVGMVIKDQDAPHCFISPIF
jgi:hypothetical protein